MKYLIALFLLLAWSVGAQQFTEFYCDASNGGTNINSGDTTNATPDYTSIAGNWNGTDTFTPTDGTFPANTNTIAVGRWAAVVVSTSTNLVQAGSKGGWVSKILTINSGANGTIVLSTTAFAGTAPGSQTGTAELRVGGAWRGPYGSSGFSTIQFPFSFIAPTATNGASVWPRVNFRNTASYTALTPNGYTHSVNGPIRFQGMTASAGDGGKATFDGGATGTSYVLLTESATSCDYADLIFQNNGNSGSAAALVNCTGGSLNWLRCVFHNAYRHGLSLGANSTATSCESYSNNIANVANQAGIAVGGARSALYNCISWSNYTANSLGFYITESAAVKGCIAYGNGLDGMLQSSQSGLRVWDSDFYQNGGSGINCNIATIDDVSIINCNFVHNGGCAVSNSAAIRMGHMINCGLGSGTMANGGASTIFNAGGIEEIGTKTYTANTTPWNSPNTGDFTPATGSAAKSAGYGLFTQTTGNTGTVAYPDIGAAQAADTNTTAGASGGSYTFAQ